MAHNNTTLNLFKLYDIKQNNTKCLSKQVTMQT